MLILFSSSYLTAVCATKDNLEFSETYVVPRRGKGADSEYHAPRRMMENIMKDLDNTFNLVPEHSVIDFLDIG